MLNKEARAGKKAPLNNLEKTYIIGNHKNTTVPTMARYLKRGVARVYDYMDQEGLEVYNPNSQGKKRKNVLNMDFERIDFITGIPYSIKDVIWS